MKLFNAILLGTAIATGYMVYSVIPAPAQEVNQDLPFHRCEEFTGLKRLVCFFSQSEYRDPKYCPEIHQFKFVPASASCEKGDGHRSPPAPSRERSRPDPEPCHSYDK
jgi:hypothetical protein